jgi:sugar O-acyltransferase (sialic acid O-acetyltransferase NeuD family)
MTYFIKAPLINVNDESAVFHGWAKSAGTFVRKGEIIGVLETAKATFELEAEQSGYLHTFVSEGAQVAVGEVLGALAETPDERPVPPPAETPAPRESADRKLTKKAELAARKAGLDNAEIHAAIPGTGNITEADVEEYLRKHQRTPAAHDVKDTVDDAYPRRRQERLLIIGGGLGAVQVLDSLSRIEHQRATVAVDDNPSLHRKTLMGVPIMGGQDAIRALYEQGLFDAAVVSVSTSIPFREKMWELMTKLKVPMANVIDPSARVQQNAVLGTGNVILAYCHIGACAILGNGAFLSPYVDIEHHCTVGDYCTFGPGVMMSSLVRIGARVKFGTGVFIEPEIEIGADSIVGSGAILTRGIPANSIVKTKVNYAIRPRP